MLAPGALNVAAISFAFAARSNAQKCRALPPNGEKRSHGVIPALLHSPAQPQFPRNPLAHFPDTTRPLSLQPPIDWAVTLPLAGDFLKHLSTGHHKWCSLTLLSFYHGARLV